MPKPPTSPAGRAPVRAHPRRLHTLLALTAVALPLVALAPADAVVPGDAPWDVTVIEGDVAVRGMTTARTLDEALEGLGFVRGPFDRIELAPIRLADGTTPLRLVRVELDRETHAVELPMEVILIEDPDLLRGLAEVVREGRPGIAIATELVLRVEGEVESRLTVQRIISQPAIDRIERVGTREEPRSTVWDALARCESSGRWDVVREVSESISYHGGLQFDSRTWNAFRPAAFPELASQATREQQIAVGERVLDAQGWKAWPACSKRLGLR